METAYWTALAWSGAIVLSLDDPQILGELAYAEAMMDRIMGLDPDWEYGTLHGFFITYEMSRLGGEVIRRESDPAFQRAKELSGGNMASYYVAMAESVAVEKGDKELFVSLLNQVSYRYRCPPGLAAFQLHLSTEGEMAAHATGLVFLLRSDLCSPGLKRY